LPANLPDGSQEQRKGRRNDAKRTKRKGKEIRNKTQIMDEERGSYPFNSECRR
jgi:hypothetical protein